MFGLDQRDHEDGTITGMSGSRPVDAIWERDDFDFDGHYLQLKGVRAKPKPYRETRPIVMNAAQSPAGRAFAIRHCDALLRRRVSLRISIRVADEVRTVKRAPQISDGQSTCIRRACVTCRPTQKEADEYLRYCVEENADWGAIEGFSRTEGPAVQTAPLSWSRFAAAIRWV